jgi:hypothetical protein
MKAKVEALKNSPIIEIIYPEETTFNEVADSINSFFALKESVNNLCLANCSHIKTSSFNSLDSYRAMNLIKSFGDLKKAKEAIFYPQGLNESASKDSGVYIFEKIARMSGFNVKIFYDRDKAIEWLSI